MNQRAASPPRAVRTLDAAQLWNWPLPRPAAHDDKEARGRVLIVAGSPEMPGGAVLAATAALRAGAGKVTVATPASIATAVAVAVPEARVIAMPETAAGGIVADAVHLLEALAPRVNAVLVGPGMQDEASACAFTRALLPLFAERPVVLDACAMQMMRGSQAYQEDAENVRDTHLVLTPHAGEMARLLHAEKQAVQADPCRAAQDAARNWNAVVALKGSRTVVARPHGDTWQHEDGNAGLATSGSGDVLAGIIAGLAARGAGITQSVAWGVVLHAQAGHRLARRIGSLGYLARELAGEIPGLMDRLASTE